MRGNVFKRLGYILFIVIFVGIILLSCYVGVIMFQNFATINTNESTKTKSSDFLESVGFDMEQSFGDYKQYIEKVEVTSTEHGHTIPADYITVDGNKDNNTVILVHGISGDRTTMYPLCRFFLDEGYNVLTYDQRNCGDNMAKYTSFGYLESNDLSDYIGYIEEQIGEDKSITLLGQSSGATTIALYACQTHANEHIDLIILDSPLVNIEDMVRDSIKNLEIKFPENYMLVCGTWANKFKLGFFYGDVNMTNMMYKCMIPTLIIHSKEDVVSSYEQSEEIFDMVPHESKKLCTLQKSLHMMGYYDYPDQYISNVRSVLDSYAKQSTGRAEVIIPEETK